MFDFQPGNERYRISLWYLGHRAIFRTQTSARVRDLDFLLLSTQIVRLQLVLIVQIDFFWRLERYADKPSEIPAFRFHTSTDRFFQVHHPQSFYHLVAPVWWGAPGNRLPSKLGGLAPPPVCSADILLYRKNFIYHQQLPFRLSGNQQQTQQHRLELFFCHRV